jgi:hypothetical protein
MFFPHLVSELKTILTKLEPRTVFRGDLFLLSPHQSNQLWSWHRFCIMLKFPSYKIILIGTRTKNTLSKLLPF